LTPAPVARTSAGDLRVRRRERPGRVQQVRAAFVGGEDLVGVVFMVCFWWSGARPDARLVRLTRSIRIR
jgi:hypothetical protein